MLGTKAKAKLTIRNGKQANACFHLVEGDKKIIGRDNSCHLQVLDKGISRNHSLLEHKGDHFLLVDLGSTNGTFVNNKIIISKRLGDGDVIKIGQTELLFEDIKAEKKSSASFVEDVLLDHNTIMERVDVGNSLCGFSVEDLKRESNISSNKTEDTAATYLNTIYEVSNLINAEQDQKKLLDAVMGKILEVFKPDRAVMVMEVNGDFDVVVAKPPGGEELKLSRTILTKTIHEGISVLSGNAALDFANCGRSIITQQLKSVMSVPLEARDKILGAIYVELGSVNRFTKSHLDLLTAIGKQAGVAIERARLSEENMEAEKLKQTMEIAQNIQKSLLPTNVPEDFEYDLVGWNRTCDETGGDYYDFFELPKRNKLAFAIGDVSGHGIAAAFLMATARAFLKALALQNKEIPDMFAELNALLEQDMEDEKFMTLFYGELDRQNLTLRYANAGHESPLLYRRSKDIFEELESTGMPLGMLDDTEYEEGEEVQIEPGDLLILLTDGITESMNPQKEQFGIERFRELIRRSAHKSGNQIVRECFDTLQQFCQGTPQRDDLTLVVFKFERRVMATQKLVTM